MNAQEKIIYIANILYTMRIDGKIDTLEEKAFNLICIERNLKRNDIKDAEQKLSRTDYKPHPVGRFSDQICNIEDMILISLTNGDIQAVEKETIISFAKQIGVSQEQLNKISIEANLRNTDVLSKKMCLKCNIEYNNDTKYCKECGSPISSNDNSKIIKLEFDYPSSGFSIEFAESSSALFDTILKIARRSPIFQEIERNKKKWYLASWASGNLDEVIELVQNLDGLKNKKLWINGSEYPWSEQFSFLWCYKQRKTAFIPNNYCFGLENQCLNIWGCNQFGLDWDEYSEWFTYGRFINRDTFEFDKKQIEHEVSIELHRNQFCPGIRKKYIQAIFKNIPDCVKVNEKEGWQYNECSKDTPKCIQVIKKYTIDGETFADKIYTNGVMPVGLKVAKSIMKKSISECNITDIDIDKLIKNK